MARTVEDVRHEIQVEREQLAEAVGALRSRKLRPKLPALAAGALGAGFVLAGGIRATVRLLFRRGREGSEKARFGRFTFRDRR